MTYTNLVTISLIASHLLCAALAYRIGRLYPRRRPDLAPKQKRHPKQCPACHWFIGEPVHNCPKRSAD